MTDGTTATTPSTTSKASTNTTNVPVPKEWTSDVSNLYEPIRSLGKGGFASVVLAKRKKQKLDNTTNDVKNDGKDNPMYVAIKVVGDTSSTSTANTNTTTKTPYKKSSAWLYAQREVDILRALNHSNIMKVLRYWDVSTNKKKTTSSSSNTSTLMIMALSYAKGPTLQTLLHRGGAISNIFGRTIIAQIVDAIAYLHSRAVIHRDIKPDNIIISGAVSTDDTIWDNPSDFDDDDDDDDNINDNKNKEQSTTPKTPSWRELIAKWHVTIIDFGFARALTKDDVTKPSLQIRRENLDASFHPNDVLSKSHRLQNSNNNNNSNSNNNSKSIRQGGNKNATKQQNFNDDDGFDDDNKNGNDDDGNQLDLSRCSAISKGSLGSSRGSKRNRKSLMRSISSFVGIGAGDAITSLDDSRASRRSGGDIGTSRHMTRTMSALGNRMYAAPEILKVKKQQGRHSNVSTTGTTAKSASVVGLDNDDDDDDVDDRKLNSTISEFVSEYGFLVDAYSLGCTIRYCMTGVPPNISVSQAIADQQQAELVSKLFSCCMPGGGHNNNKKNHQNIKRKPRYRLTETLPEEVQRMIRKMTERSEKDRTSVRQVRKYYPWIFDVLSSSSSSSTDKENNENKTTYDDDYTKIHYLNLSSSSSTTTKPEQQPNDEEEEEENAKA